MNPFHVAYLVTAPFHQLDDVFGLLDGLDEPDRDIVLECRRLSAIAVWAICPSNSSTGTAKIQRNSNTMIDIPAAVAAVPTTITAHQYSGGCTLR